MTISEMLIEAAEEIEAGNVWRAYQHPEFAAPSDTPRGGR
jgi:hypothetical protein